MALIPTARSINLCSSFLFRRVIVVGLTSFVLIAGNLGVVRGEWFAFPKFRKAADSGSEARQSNRGFNGTIRKLLKEARDQEEQGNLDRAIVLAERAVNVSEATSNIAKTAPECSPTATSKYANELRLKKVDLTVKRLGASPVRKHSPDKSADRSEEANESPRIVDIGKTRESKSRPDRPQTIGFTVPANGVQPAVPPANQDSTTSNSAKSVTIKTGLRSTDFVDDVISSDRTSITLAPSILPENVEEDDWASPAKPLSVEVVANHPLKPPAGSDDLTDANDDFSDDELQFIVTPMQVASPKSTPVSDSVLATCRLKLRPRFDDLAIDSNLPVVVPRPADRSFDREPLITPMVADALFSNAETSFHSVQPIAAEVDANPEEIQLVLTDDRGDDTAAEDSWDEPAEESFPRGKVLELKQRMETAAALNPGEVLPNGKSRYDDITAPDAEADLQTKASIWAASRIAADLREGSESELFDERDSSLRIVRAQESRRPRHALTSAAPAPNSARTARPPIIAQTSVIQWRVAKETPAVPPTLVEARASQVDRFPQDLRQTLRDVNTSRERTEPSGTRSIFTLPTIQFGGKTASHNQTTPAAETGAIPEDAASVPSLSGATWDHAELPPIQSPAESNRIDVTLPRTAPLPPFEGIMVEQTGFLDSDQLAAVGHPFPIHEQGLSDSFDISPKLRLQDPFSKQSVKISSGSPSARDALSESTRTVLANGPIERTALLFGIPVSQASSMLGVGGVILLILGLWMIRAVVRTEKP